MALNPFKTIKSSVSNFFDFIKSVFTSQPAKEIAATSIKKSQGFLSNAVLGIGVFLGHLALGPVGAVASGVIIHQLQKSNKSSSKPNLQKRAFSAVTIGTSIGAGSVLGIAAGTALAGPIGAVIGGGLGAAAGGIFGKRIYRSLTQNQPLFNNSSQSLNAFTKFTDTISSGINSILKVPRGIFKFIGLSFLVILILAVGSVFFLLSSFIIPNQTSTATSPPTTSYGCEGKNKPPPDAGNIVFSADNKYAFPVAPLIGYGCAHWDGVFAADIFVGTSSAQDPLVGLPVLAYTSGTIVYAGENSPHAGTNITLKGNDGRTYYYSHNCANYVSSGQSVSAGQVIATTDRTGLNAQITPEHLHFQIDDSSNNSICPQTDFEDKFNLSRCQPAQQCATQ